jgi:hypothetical protein
VVVLRLSIASHPGVAPGSCVTHAFRGACTDVCVCVFVCECVYAYVRARALLSAVSKGSHV